MAERTGPMKPAFPYYGGKQRIADWIVSLLPPHGCYVEPFAGGAAILFKKGIPPNAGQSYVEVINDLDEMIINFYRVLQSPRQCKVLIDRLDLTLFSRSEFVRAGEITRGKVQMVDEVDGAWAWLVGVCQAFGNKPRLTSGSWGVARAQNLAVAWGNQRDRVGAIVERFQSVVIEHDDALNVIDRHDSAHTLHYCDPPYPETNQTGYEHCYTSDDFQRLVDVLDATAGSFVLSCYEVPGVVIPNDWEKFERSTFCSVSAEGKTNRSKAERGVSKAHDAALTKKNERVEVAYRKVRGVRTRATVKSTQRSIL